MNKIKMNINARPLPIAFPHPVALAGANIDDKANFTTVAMIGLVCGNPTAFSVSLQPHRHTFKGIRQNMTFSINIPSRKIVNETDYCGLVSGSKTDKVKDCGFKIFYGTIKSAPLIEQCPVNISCEVVQILRLGSHYLIVGQVQETFIDGECGTDGQADITKIEPLLFISRKYYTVGEKLADAYATGRVIRPLKADEGIEQFKV